MENQPAPVDTNTAITAEWNQIRARRKHLGQSEDRDLLGLAFSGGGIRSATFNLGILQGIARANLLPCVDYLSTVSGGGYIGAWLHALIKREGGGNPEKVKNFLERPDREPHFSPPDHGSENEPPYDPIAFLRKFSSYLAPDLGLLSADLWVILVIWIRNTLLNQLILVSFLACISSAVLLLTFYSHLFVNPAMGLEGTRYGIVELLLGIAFLGYAIWRGGQGTGAVTLEYEHQSPPDSINDVRQQETRREEKKKRNEEKARALDTVGNGVLCAALTLAACFLFAAASAQVKNASGWALPSWMDRFRVLPPMPTWCDPIICVIGPIAGLLLTGGFLFLQKWGKFNECYRDRRPSSNGEKGGPPILLKAIYVLIPGCVTGYLFAVIAKLISNWVPPQIIAWGTPMFAVAILVGTAIYIGLLGIDYPDNSREWLARVGANIAIDAFAWAALFALIVYAPLWLLRLADRWWPVAAGLGGGWVITSLAGALAGSSGKTSGNPDQPGGSKILQTLASVAPSIFVAGFIITISFALQLGIIHWAHIKGTETNHSSEQVNPKVIELKADSHRILRLQVPAKATPAWLRQLGLDNGALLEIYSLQSTVLAWTFLGIAGIVVGLLPLRVDINEFSMHHFYKNRLVRCYLGATRRKRRPSLLTGFDPDDDLKLIDLKPTSKHPYYGPLPILNTCLNLNTGSELAKRERKGSAFTYTPVYTGFNPPRTEHDQHEQQSSRETKVSSKLHPEGFRETEYFGYINGPHIGSCMAISGAAANPNGGFQTSPASAFLMTMFDVRLGWWVGNPRRDKESRRPGPRHALITLLSELFAQTDATSRFLNLSDGGHFENLGIYELVRRRCKYIIAGDGEQDQQYTFDSLGGAVRKCRTDFGVEIEIDPRRIRLQGDISRTHCVVGRIRYPHAGEKKAFHGYLLYLKSSLTGDEPEDVAQYKLAHLDFPQQPTTNQFFTESQFESYRKVGLHVWESATQNWNGEITCDKLDEFFECMYRGWYPPTEVNASITSGHANTYSQLINKLMDQGLAPLKDQILSPAGKPREMPGEEPNAQQFLYVLELIQLIENVWSDLGMRERIHRESPANLGWVTVFLHWTHQPAFRAVWKQSRHTFNPLFQQFYNTLAKFDLTQLPEDHDLPILRWYPGGRKAPLDSGHSEV